MLLRNGFALLVGLFGLAAAGSPAAAQTEALFDLSAIETGPFPTNVFTRGDGTNLTNRRIALPRPDCTLPANTAACNNVDTLGTLDGFNPQPRVRIPFDGDINVSTVSSRTLFFVNLGDTANPTEMRGLGEVVGVNQVIFDPESDTLFAESDALLRQHTRYALIATTGILDAAGQPVRGSAFAAFLARQDFSSSEVNLRQYQNQLRLALDAARVNPATVASASVFTTLSTTAILEKVRQQIQRVVPAPARFDMGTSGGERAVFPLDGVDTVMLNRQVGTSTFVTSAIGIQALSIVPGSVGTIAFGTFASPSFLTSDRVIPAVGTRTGTPEIQRFNIVGFTLFVPSGPKPAAGWPISLFGHGFSGEKNNSVITAATLASQGIASIAINVVGHGGGSQGTITVNRRNGTPVTIPSGGRGMDLNGDGNIDATEGFNASNGLIGSRDGLRQTVADLMQLTWMIRNRGIDVDNDGAGDFDPDRIFYLGTSLGGIYGVMLLGAEPNLRAGVPNVPGGIQTEIARFSPNFRPLLGAAFSVGTPPLANALPIAAPLFGFNENIPLRNQPPVVNNVPRSVPLMEIFETFEWVTISGDPLGYARHIRAEPLAGNQPKPLIFQFARGDMTVPNPTATALVRAGAFQDRVTFFRNDLFVQQMIAAGVGPAATNALRNPHGFIASVTGARAPIGLGAQMQVATFFASNGATTVDPDGAGPLFETPIVTLPEDVGFLPLLPVPPPMPAPAPTPVPAM